MCNNKESMFIFIYVQCYTNWPEQALTEVFFLSENIHFWPAKQKTTNLTQVLRCVRLFRPFRTQFQCSKQQQECPFQTYSTLCNVLEVSAGESMWKSWGSCSPPRSHPGHVQEAHSILSRTAQVSQGYGEMLYKTENTFILL